MTLPDATLEHGVTLWGAPGAGKSGLLGALYAASLAPDADGWSAHPKDAEDALTQERLKDAYLGLRGRTNTKTGMPAAGEYPPLRVLLRRRRGGRQVGAMRVALVDPAGEFSTQLELGTTREGRSLFARIARGGGVVWLVEPGQRPHDVGARMLALQHLVALLEASGGRQLGIPVALCLSKVDQLPDAERAAARADPAAALRAHLGETTFTWFEAACPAMRCFAVTSAGSVEGRVQPEGLDPVFDWLAELSTPHPTVRDRVARAKELLGTARPVVRASVALALRNRVVQVVLVAAAAVTVGAAAVQLVPVAKHMLARPVRALESLPRDSAGGAVARTATGEVARAALPDGQALARLRDARGAANRGEWRDAVDALANRVPPPALRFAWDSLYVVAALQAAADESDATVARGLREAARARATDAVRRGPAGSRRLVGLRFARGVACVDGGLACPLADVRADFTWALLGPPPMRREARLRLATLDAGGAP
ncbi:hypothetical protein J421_0389 [Gemmatirosa kalamazoonensis]|uniref:Uncharacterized protein n=1 Tax=Gemmatirosa kalamazoonensis TaxID=861299 RepID=W0RAW2_9BACT|nr:hypothetical protein [Gemmatirosa kalamazoonensis]AHG87926.1 hypothetical protein J421_0389 [Gemmatirosa kalamazoonensis]